MSAKILICDPRTDPDRFGVGERLNVVATGKRFRCNFIEAGLVSYSDQGGDTELLRRETIAAALDTLSGNPLTIGHISTRLNQSELKRLTRGSVDAFGYDQATGWFFCEGPITDDHARSRIRANARPSVGYTVLEFGPGGVWHNIPYAREIKKIKFHHLAIVDTPRYEAADFRLNAKKLGAPAMSLNPIKWLKKTLRPAVEAGAQPTEVEEKGELPVDTVLELEDGTKVRLNELVDAHKAKPAPKPDDPKPADKPADDTRENAIDGEAMIDVGDGQTVKLNDLIAGYKAPKADKPADKPADQRDNAGPRAFKVLGAARNAPAPIPTERANSANTVEEQMARGRARYGSVPAGKN